MKKVISLVLSALMAFSALTVGAVTASAAETEEDTALAFTAGSDIYFDNSETRWDTVYMYAWGMGYFGDFVEMEASGRNLYSTVAPVDVEAGKEYFLFTNSTDWTGEQTPNIVTEAGMNEYTPVVNDEGKVISVTQSEKASSTAAKVVIAPKSKEFTSAIDVTVYAFNTEDATYSINGGTPVAFTGAKTLTLEQTSTVTVTAGSDTETCTYKMIENAVITAKVSGYTGDMYIYTYGGDRVAPGFAQMNKAEDGTYTYILNGSAHVIFTTTNDWSTAEKFIIDNSEDQEPFVAAGQHPEYTLSLATPVVPAE